MKLRDMALKAAETLLPLPCPLCGGKPADGSPNMLCEECLAGMRLLKAPFCPGCGGELGGILELCPDCLKSPKRPWRQAASVFKMEGEAANLIYLFKYRERPDLARPLGRLAARALKERGMSAELIVPTPLHWLRSLQRGFNQAALLCESISRETGIPLAKGLRRTKWTRQQAKLDRKERFSNILGAFSASNSPLCKNRSILLVDDVMTTGATLSAAASALLDAGAAEVAVLTLARRQRD